MFIRKLKLTCLQKYADTNKVLIDSKNPVATIVMLMAMYTNVRKHQSCNILCQHSPENLLSAL